jgi:histidinol phosphatase-like enzyme (inositol monophosphatase family)
VPTIDEIEKSVSFANKLADAARHAILPYFRTENGVENKSLTDFDPVTMADRAAEAAMRSLIFENRPNDAIEGEEYGTHLGTSGWQWILDPIDGTRAFMAGTSTWGVLIGGYFDGVPIVGVMDQPFTGERWIGAPNFAKWLRADKEQPLATNNEAQIKNSVIATTDPFLFHGEERLAFDEIRKMAPVTRYGLDCTAYGYLAMGSIGLVVETGLKLVDIAALIPIVENAGGIVTDWRGNKNPNGGQVIAAANQQIHAQALAILSRAAI